MHGEEEEPSTRYCEPLLSLFESNQSSIAMEPMYCMPAEKSAPKIAKPKPRRSFNDTTSPVEHTEHIEHDEHDEHGEHIEHTTLSPTEADPDCRCGCIPKEIMSMFQMAALRKKYQERLRMEAESEALSDETATPTPSISLL